MIARGHESSGKSGIGFLDLDQGLGITGLNKEVDFGGGRDAFK